MTRNYQACCRNLTSDAVSGMDDFETGRLFAYSYYTWVFYQDAVIEHTKAIISHVFRVYGARDGTPTQLKKLYHEKADTLKKRTEEARNAIAHGGGFISRALTEDQWWEASAALGMHPSYLLDEHHYAERGQSVRSGSYDQIMKTGPQGFLDDSCSEPPPWWVYAAVWSSSIPIIWLLWYFFRPAKLRQRRLRKERRTPRTASRSASLSTPVSDTESRPTPG